MRREAEACMGRHAESERGEPAEGGVCAENGFLPDRRAVDVGGFAALEGPCARGRGRGPEAGGGGPEARGCSAEAGG